MKIKNYAPNDTKLDVGSKNLKNRNSYSIEAFNEFFHLNQKTLPLVYQRFKLLQL